MGPEALDPVQVRRLRKMSPAERLQAAFGLNDLVDELARAGDRHRQDLADGSATEDAEA